MKKVTENPVISVIIPVYNDENVLDGLFFNLNNQSLEPNLYEIIFINDGSTDNSESIIRKFIKKRNNCFLYNQNNLKQAEARNHGIKEAKGKYVLFIDSDDSFSNDYLNVMYKNANSYNAIFSNIEKIFPNGKVTKEKSIFSNNDTNIVKDYLSRGIEVDNGVWSNLYNLDFLLENDITFENSNFFEDSLFNLKVLTSSKKREIKYLDFYGYKLMKHSETTTNSFHPELYSLVLSYLKRTDQIVGDKNIKLNKYSYRGFVLRQFVYLLHHYIKFSNYKNAIKITRNINFKDIFNFKLPLKYIIAVFLIKFMFPMYFFTYKYSYRLKYR